MNLRYLVFFSYLIFFKIIQNFKTSAYGEIYLLSYKMFLNNPITGIGINNFKYMCNNFDNYKNMMLINKEIYSYLDNFEYKRIRLMREMNNLCIKYNAIEDKNDDDLYYPSSFNKPWNVYNCINFNCPCKNISLGVVHTYSVNKDDYEIFGSTLIKSSFPLKKVSEKKNSYLTPIIAARYSPNNTKNISNNDVRLSYSNIFSFNRIGTNEIVEGGKSLAIGVEYKNKDIYDNDILGISIANSLSDRKNENLPTKSKLNQTRSDIVGDITYAPNNIINFNYSFSLDKNLNYSNYDSIFTKINVNNFVTTFNFLSQDAELGNNEVLSNMIAYKFNNENSFKFNTTKDLKNDFTEYYNLIYQYESDCLLASLEYRKKFYQDGSLLPDKSLLFYIKFIPFAEIRPAAQKLQ